MDQKITIEFTKKEAAEMLGAQLSTKLTTKFIHALRGTKAKKNVKTISNKSTESNQS